MTTTKAKATPGASQPGVALGKEEIAGQARWNKTSVPCFPCFIRTTRRSTSDGKGAIPPAATFATLSSPDEHRVAGHVVGNRAQIRKILRFGVGRGRKRRAAPAAPPLLIRINPANPNSPHRPGQVGRREAEHALRAARLRARPRCPA